jgi:hypothetical protein
MDLPEHHPVEVADDVDQTIDITDDALTTNRTFRVSDRVERLRGETALSQWGTITAPSDDESNGWFVQDNGGITHLDEAADLAPAVRGGARKRKPDDA